MSTRPELSPNQSLLDPDRLEAAGRRLRRWLDGLRRPAQAESNGSTDIAWEDGEPRDGAGGPPTALG